MNDDRNRAFTMIEILVVVIILGILAAIVVPQFAGATAEAQRAAIADEVGKVRRVLAVYYVRSGNVYPTVTVGDGTWGELLAPGSSYMRQPSVNSWVGGVNAKKIILRNTPDTAYHADYGWIFDPATGNLWAAACDYLDNPFPRP